MTEQSTMGAEARRLIDCLTPPEEVLQHLRNSRIEFWKAVRAMVDHRIDHLSNQGKKGTPVTVE